MNDIEIIRMVANRAGMTEDDEDMLKRAASRYEKAVELLAKLRGVPPFDEFEKAWNEADALLAEIKGGDDVAH